MLLLDAYGVLVSSSGALTSGSLLGRHFAEHGLAGAAVLVLGPAP